MNYSFGSSPSFSLGSSPCPTPLPTTANSNFFGVSVSTQINESIHLNVDTKEEIISLIKNGDLEEFKSFILKESTLLMCNVSPDNSLLYHAASYGQLPMVKWIIRMREKLNYSSKTVKLQTGVDKSTNDEVETEDVGNIEEGCKEEQDVEEYDFYKYLQEGNTIISEKFKQDMNNSLKVSIVNNHSQVATYLMRKGSDMPKMEMNSPEEKYIVKVLNKEIKTKNKVNKEVSIPSSIKGVERYYNDKVLSDVKFVFPNILKEIDVHRLLLRPIKHIESVLANNFIEKEQMKITFDEEDKESEEVFLQIVKYFYGYDMNIKKRQFGKALTLCDKYDIPELYDVIEKEAIEKIDQYNCIINFLDISLIERFATYTTHCLMEILKNINEMKETELFRSIRMEHFVLFFLINKKNPLVEENTIFTALSKWILQQGKVLNHLEMIEIQSIMYQEYQVQKLEKLEKKFLPFLPKDSEKIYRLIVNLCDDMELIHSDESAHNSNNTTIFRNNQGRYPLLFAKYHT